MEIIKGFSFYVLPLVILLVSIIFLFSKKDILSHFLKGATQGLKSVLGLLPSICLLVVGVNMLFASGAIEILSEFLSPLFNALGIPSDILPLIVTRPLSFGASLASYKAIIDNCGVDSFSAICATIIMSSTDTVFYVACAYFSTTKIKKTGYFLPVALFVSFFSVFLSCTLARLFFE